MFAYRCFLLALAACLLPSSVFAQTIQEIESSPDLVPVDPGARAPVRPAARQLAWLYKAPLPRSLPLSN